MNKIKLAKGYYVEIDNLNYMLKKRVLIEKGKDAGKKKGKTLGYYSNLKGAIQGFLKFYHIEYGGDRFDGLESYVKEVERLNKKAVRLIEKQLQKDAVETQK